MNRHVRHMQALRRSVKGIDLSPAQAAERAARRAETRLRAADAAQRPGILGRLPVSGPTRLRLSKIRDSVAARPSKDAAVDRSAGRVETRAPHIYNVMVSGDRYLVRDESDESPLVQLARECGATDWAGGSFDFPNYRSAQKFATRAKRIDGVTGVEIVDMDSPPDYNPGDDNFGLYDRGMETRSRGEERSVDGVETRGGQLSPMAMANKLRDLFYALKNVEGVDEMVIDTVGNFAEEISADPVPASEEYGMDWAQFRRFVAKPLKQVRDEEVQALLAEILASVSQSKSARGLVTRAKKGPLAALVAALADVGEDQVIADYDLKGPNPDLEGAYDAFRRDAYALGDGPEVEDVFAAFRVAMAKRSAGGLVTKAVPASTALSRLHDRVGTFLAGLDAGALTDLVADEAEDFVSIVDSFNAGAFTPAEAAIALQGVADRFDDLALDEGFKSNDRTALGEFGSAIRRIAEAVKSVPTPATTDFADTMVEETASGLRTRGRTDRHDNDSNRADELADEMDEFASELMDQYGASGDPEAGEDAITPAYIARLARQVRNLHAEGSKLEELDDTFDTNFADLYAEIAGEDDLPDDGGWGSLPDEGHTQDGGWGSLPGGGRRGLAGLVAAMTGRKNAGGLGRRGFNKDLDAYAKAVEDAVWKTKDALLAIDQEGLAESLLTFLDRLEAAVTADGSDERRAEQVGRVVGDLQDFPTNAPKPGGGTYSEDVIDGLPPEARLILNAMSAEIVGLDIVRPGDYGPAEDAARDADRWYDEHRSTRHRSTRHPTERRRSTDPLASLNADLLELLKGHDDGTWDDLVLALEGDSISATVREAERVLNQIEGGGRLPALGSQDEADQFYGSLIDLLEAYIEAAGPRKNARGLVTRSARDEIRDLIDEMREYAEAQANSHLPQARLDRVVEMADEIERIGDDPQRLHDYAEDHGAEMAGRWFQRLKSAALEMDAELEGRSARGIQRRGFGDETTSEPATADVETALDYLTKAEGRATNNSGQDIHDLVERASLLVKDEDPDAADIAELEDDVTTLAERVRNVEPEVADLLDQAADALREGSALDARYAEPSDSVDPALGLLADEPAANPVPGYTEY